MRFDKKPLISVIAIFHDMEREAERTLFSLTRDYQNSDPSLAYEVIAIDNGSSQPIRAETITRLSPQFKYHYFDTNSVSPVEAINYGASLARGKYLVVLIDGARILSPGILKAVADIAPVYDAPFIFTLGLHLGPDVQNQSILKGYNQKVEDRLLRSVAWRSDGYQLFRIAALATSSAQGYLGALSESNCFAMRRSHFLEIGGLDKRFQTPGGGLANLDFFSRACAEPDVQPVMLLGEGTFHQVHGGVATNVVPDEHPMESFRAEFRDIRGWEWELDTSIEPVYFGKLPEAAKLFLKPPEPSSKFIGPQLISRPQTCKASCVLVLGMHRSGTSVLAKVVHEMGFPVASEPLPPRDSDNEEGYWEPRRVVQINNSFLHVIGRHWASTGPIPQECFEGEDANLHRHEIREFLLEAMGQNRQFMIKDPRLCRLLPLWMPVFEEAGIDLTVLIIHRDVEQVFQSLCRRADDPEIASAAIADPTQAYLLWIRYYLDAEHNTRNCSRHMLSYEQWIDAPATYISEIRHFIADTLVSANVGRATGSVSKQRDAQHLAPGNDLARLAITMREKLVDSDVSADARLWLDKLHHLGETLVPASNQPSDPLPEPTVISNHCKIISGAMPSNPASYVRSGKKRWRNHSGGKPIIFVSDNPDSRSHIYRVKNPVDALNRKGQPSFWTTSTQLLRVESLIADAQSVVVHRSEWSSALARLVAICKANSVPITYDMDDLLLDPSLVSGGKIHFINALEEEEQSRWVRYSERLLTAAQACGQVICSTQVLAERARELGLQAQIIENGFSQENLDMASHWHARKATLTDRLRIGYASGTPTHSGDFALVQQALSRWLAANPQWCLTIIGDWDIAPDQALVNREQLELRPGVNPVNLSYELARLTINLIPLENTAFCDSKSPLKWYEAALAGTPSIATANGQYRELFHDQTRGLVARTEQDWFEQIDKLAHNSALQAELAGNAQKFCEEHFHAANLARRYLAL